MSVTKYQIVCSDYRSRLYGTRELAERVLASIEKDGFCQAEHRVEEVNHATP